MPDDEELMVRVGRGDHVAYQTLVSRHLSRAIGLATRIAGNRGDGEELAQEAFLRVWTTAPRWRPEGAKFRTWFSRVLVNLCIDRKRRPGWSPLEAAGDPVDPSASAFETVSTGEDAGRIQAAMAELPERQRAALVLCYWGEQGNIEAAATLGVSVGALESLLVRARRTLREKLEASGGR